MDNKRLQQLAGISPLFEEEGQQTITADGFKLEQEKNFEEDNWYIIHNVFKGQKHIATLDHNPRQWIDEKTFNKYVEFYQKYGRFPNRDDVRTGQQIGGSLTNQQIQTLKENDYDPNSSHYQEEEARFNNAIKALQDVRRFIENEDGTEEQEYQQMYQYAGKLMGQMQSHLRKYQK